MSAPPIYEYQYLFSDRRSKLCQSINMAGAEGWRCMGPPQYEYGDDPSDGTWSVWVERFSE